MKKSLILGCLIATLSITAVFADVNIFMNGRYLDLKDTKPIVKEGRTTLPVSTIAKNLGIEYTWDNDTKTVTFKQDGKELNLKVGEDNTFVQNGRTYAPLKYIADTFDIDLDWRADSKTVVIGDNAKEIPVLEIEVEDKVIEKEDKKKYNELSDFKSTPIGESEIFKGTKNVEFVVREMAGAEKIQNVYHLKKEDLPIRIGNAVITKLEKDVGPNRIDVPDRQEVIMVSGYVLEGDIGSPSFQGGFIDKDKLYRHRGIMTFSINTHNHFINKYPYLKGLNDQGKYLNETKTGEKFTYIMPLTNAGSDIEDDWYKFQVKQADKIVLYSWEVGRDVIVFDNFLK